MDACEAMKIVMSRIQKLDGENGSRIIGYMLIQDEGEKEVIRLASGPDALLISTVNQVKACLGLSLSPKSLNPLPPFLSPRARINGSGAHSPQSHPFHRRSYSVNDAEGGLGYTTYFAENNAADFDDFLRLQHQRFGAHPQFSNYNKSTNFLNENQRCGPRNEFSPVAMAASSSRQIYLTFPADSAFKEEDVSGYFSMFGPVQDVRIPYQQKRMFGFVTFRYPETVKLILAKGNPHYVCDSRVLVKPYKEKGKVHDKKQFHQQHLNLEREGMDSKEFFDPPIVEHTRLATGSRMLFDRQEILRRQLEQEAELHNAMELQCSRMDNLQLMDLKYRQHSTRFLPSFAAGVSVSSPRYSQPIDNVVVSSDLANPNVVLQGLGDRRESLEAVEADGRNSVPEETESSSYNNDSNSNRNRHVNDDDSYLPESLEHFLPGTLFASPTKPVAED